MMKEQHRIAARVAARVKTSHVNLPSGVTDVAARLGPPLVRDRATGKTAYLYTDETPHMAFSGRAAVGEALSPARPAPRVSGAVPRRRKAVVRKISFPLNFHFRTGLIGLAAYFC